MYEFAVSGRVPADWSDWFDAFEITVVGTDCRPITMMRGPVRDQAALHGVLARIRDLALPLLWARLVTTPDERSGNTPPGT